MDRFDHVAVVGTGIMGSAIARRLLGCGVQLTVCDIDTEKTAPLEEAGAYVASSPKEASSRADVVILSLPHEAAVEAVVFGPDGIASAAEPNRHLIDMSSIAPSATRAFAGRLAKTCGTVWVDSPLSGGAPKVKDGELAVMVGGTQRDLEAIRPAMAYLASTITLMGPVGAGQATKLVNQLIAGCAFQTLAEAVTLAEASGVDVTLIAEAIKGGRADSNIVQEFLPMMARRRYEPTGTLRSMVKDFTNIEAEAAAVGVPLPLTSLAGQLHRLAVRQGHGDAQNAAILTLYQAVN